ncbi:MULTISPECIES: glycosyltransferase family 39 protein [Okeania]|uniref:glycosyltransferase family 39 protein n=1 Tax=Okeania TaxID=1458928 RepID=UPI001374DE60|nr:MULTISPECIES: glycosyltransferase family 39 protein [Okeania]NES88105.1 glycosyltransferase [Okeania sp. SIO2B9]NET76500.1 glycosyltransferase [Okeania sp. SIO1F9]
MRKFNRDINQKIVNFWRRSLHSQWLLLLVWIAIATCLRLTNLDGKPPWTDEFSTLVFSLGNSFQDVPLDRAIAPDILLQPLQLHPNAEIKDVVDHLLTHSNHPPVYFILTHWWMQFFSKEGELVSLWGARSLSVIFGVASIPAIYGLAKLAFDSRLVGQLAAAIMAVSPYGIYLAQEARHYTLAILFVIASFSCLIISIRHFQQGQSLPIFTAFIWVVVNSLGIAIHYFFILTLCAEAMVLISLFFVEEGRRKKEEGRGKKQQGRRKKLMEAQTFTKEGRGNREEGERKKLMDTQTFTKEGRGNKEEGGRKKLMRTQTFTKEGRGNREEVRRKNLMGTQTSTNFQHPVDGEVLNSKEKDKFSSLKVKKSSKFSLHTLIKSLASFYIVILGTLAGGLVWLPFWKNGYSSELTKWISISDSNLKSLLSPIFQYLATGITMLFLLPIESPIFPIAIISVAVMILFFIWLFPLFISGTINCLKNSDISIYFITFAGVILASKLLFFGFTYIFGIDLTRGARYSFVYFPAVIIFVAAILAQIFERQFVKSKFLNVLICTNTGKKAVILIWLMALLSGLTVVSNLGYQKYYRPDLLVSLIEKKSDKPIVIATIHNTHVETGELMGIAWNMRKIFQQKCRKESICQEKHLEGVKFILVEQKTDRENTVNSLQEIINRLEYPFDLWLVNFASNFNIAVENCQVDKGGFLLIDGYKYQLYHCHFSGG